MILSRSSLVVALCAMYSLVASLYPFEFGDRNLTLNGYAGEFLSPYIGLVQSFRINDFLINIVYFLPWGIICYIVLDWRGGGMRTLVMLAASIGAVISITIELCQVFFYRHPSAFDVLANSFGAVAGALLCALSPIDLRKATGRVSAWLLQSRVFFVIVITFGIIPLIVSVSNYPWLAFHNWNRDYTFQLGNEATLDRPWLGVIYLIAIYDRPLTPIEIARIYELGSSNVGARNREAGGLIALYTFAERRGDTVRDVSGYERPLDLTLSPLDHFRWLPQGNGIEILKPAILTSNRPAEKLYDALQRSNEVSVEVWMKPSTALQKGPARIASFSRDTLARNFTLGQEGSDVDFRLRTPVSGLNGTNMSLRTHTGFLTPQPFHLVVTYTAGIKKLFVNGREHPGKVELSKFDIIIAFGAKNNVVGKIAYSLFYFFTVSMLLSLVFSKWSLGFKTTFLLPVLIAITILSMTEIVQAHIFGRAVDLPLICFGVIAGIIGALSGTALRCTKSP